MSTTRSHSPSKRRPNSASTASSSQQQSPTPGSSQQNGKHGSASTAAAAVAHGATASKGEGGWKVQKEAAAVPSPRQRPSTLN